MPSMGNTWLRSGTAKEREEKVISLSGQFSGFKKSFIVIKSFVVNKIEGFNDDH
jgi:hypothetical protein